MECLGDCDTGLIVRQRQARASSCVGDLVKLSVCSYPCTNQSVDTAGPAIDLLKKHLERKITSNLTFLQDVLDGKF